MSFPGSRSLVLAVAVPALGWAATGKSASEILTPSLRQATVDLAVRLTLPPTAEAPPTDLKSPFNPIEFQRLTPEEAKLAAARTQIAGPLSASAPVPAATPATVGAASGSVASGAVKSAPASDREILEQVAARIPSSGVILFGAKSLLVVGGKRYAAGSRFTVTLAGQDYEVELVAIDRLTFTLRYRGEQYARPITLR